ncbi:hypothetical protein Bcp1_152 [Bacillus phage Bcp1]|uniref:Uncharacterized protein n=1 Tax=Bacillus phage Bcp1 TaxID=584892 RepID=X2JMY8_9CAUD|nr:hypothetical protein Bcp1_152 [Bacillus phage Bcp1]AHN66627.1 hypothetical protein Bcp1_152 [Bacillus phage Bcp1]AXQ67641.1 hypothetical protein KIOSHI_158 [Bacillus phage Kioshi]
MIDSFDSIKVGDLLKWDMIWGVTEYLGREEDGTVLLKNIAGETMEFRPEGFLSYATIITDGYIKQEYWERRKGLEKMLAKERGERENAKAQRTS